ncbi:Protein of unknown function [Cotesia congregata]|uniref:Uncharacterized protein n=1 Tax=Cotesia congregata TaxID=51543 RepID=A0A8J2HLT7_COTCN|nr:Protein of unknown function [Cotesia congregata]
MLGSILVKLKEYNKHCFKSSRIDQKCNPINVNTFADILDPRMYDNLIIAIQSIVGADAESNECKSPSTATTAGTWVTKIAKLYEKELIKQREYKKAKDSESDQTNQSISWDHRRPVRHLDNDVGMRQIQIDQGRQRLDNCNRASRHLSSEIGTERHIDQLLIATEYWTHPAIQRPARRSCELIGCEFRNKRKKKRARVAEKAAIFLFSILI